MKILTLSLPAALLAVSFSLPAAAQAPQPGSPPAYTPKVSMADARNEALKVVPGDVRAGELEQEGGRWIYSFEIKPRGETRKIVKEVNIDAETGAQVGKVQTEHE